jgi:hypothetical protein
MAITLKQKKKKKAVALAAVVSKIELLTVDEYTTNC